jgi:hypothetical protein
VFLYGLSLVLTLFPYIPALLSHLLIGFFKFLALAVAPRALGFLISALLPFLRVSASAFHRFTVSPFLRYIPLAFSLLRCERLTMRLFPYSLRPAPCALFFLTMIFFLSTPVQSAQVTLQWDPNLEEDVAGYRVYYGTSSGDYSHYLDAGKTTTCTVSDLQDGMSYYFAATAYDTAFAESEFSSEVVYGGGGGCAFLISPDAQSFGSSGGAGTVSLSAGTGCSWTAFSNASWVIVTSNSSGSGSSAVYFSVTPNSSSSRSGTLTVAGKTFTVNQQGSSPSAFTINASAGANGTISPPGAVTVTAGAGQTFTLTPAPGYTVSEVKVDGGSVGAVTSYGFGNVTANHTISASFAALSPSPNLVLALNAGGGEYTDGSGARYAADQYFFGGASGKSNATIKGTRDGALYQYERYGNFSYIIPVANGSYDLTLKFVESTHSARNQRVFDVWVEGRLSLDGLDIYAVTGKDTALDITFTVSVSDGVLNLDFMPSTGDAQVSALLIMKASGTPKKLPGRLKKHFSTQAK